MNSFDSAQRVRNVLASATKVLIIPGKSWPADTLPASIGLAQVLTSRGKEALVYFEDAVPSYLSFLDFTQLRGKEWRLDKDVFDCFVAMGTEYVETASKTTMTIGVGRQGGGGTIHYSAEEASSYSEVVTRLVKTIFEDAVPPAAATNLLAGIITKTDNMKGSGVTPHTLFSAAYLVARGADREKIVDSIYKRRPIPLLRLWGKFLARVEYGAKNNVAWGTLSAEDFDEVADPGRAIPTVLKELISAAPHVAVRAVFWQDGPVSTRPTRGEVRPNLQAVMHTERQQILNELMKYFKGARHGNSIYISCAGKDGNEIARIVSDIVRARNE